LVAATLCSLPARTSSVKSASRARLLPDSLVMPSVTARACGASSSTMLVSVDSPDCEMPRHQRPFQPQRGVIEGRNRGRGQRDGNSGGNFDQIPSELRGIIRGSPRCQNHQAGRVFREMAARGFRFPQADFRVFSSAAGCCRISSSIFDTFVSPFAAQPPQPDRFS
jgi:hypothetical protein